MLYVNAEFQGMMCAQNCVAAVQQICTTNLPQLSHIIIPPVLQVPSVAFLLYNVVVKGFSALLSKPILPELQQETLCNSTCVHTTY